VAESFDPYHAWLGIPPEEQPPNRYRLLGLKLFEDDPQVIREAGERHIAFVRTKHLGIHQELSQRILNELAGAKACLSLPDKKAAYDAQLRAELAAESALADSSQRAAAARGCPCFWGGRRSLCATACPHARTAMCCAFTKRF